MQAQNTPTQNASSTGYDRRSFLKTAGLGAMAMNIPFFDIPNYLQGVPMGVVVHSYGARWHSKANSSKYPGFQNALDLIAHCKEIGAGGVQVGVNGWASDFAKKVREAREKSNLYLEGSIGLPKSTEDVGKFEQEIVAAKEAGADVLRTVCLNGRRYENFHSEKEFLNFKAASLVALSLAEPIVRKHQVKLAVENHKDWKASELAEIIQNLGSEWVGVTVDFGNNVALLEDPNKVIETLAPMAFSTHVKDMGVKEYQDGFLLSEVPLGKGIVDLEAGVALCKKYNPKINFSLEMITRDPLEIPVLSQEYWATMGNLPATELAKMLKEVKDKTFIGSLPSVSELNQEQRLAFEEENVIKSLSFSKSTLGLG
ncbi:sugar phosphate isomerase/epimerase family protein [Algoriphagus machipongonensis]|uniref:AP endonuclease, family 2 n=1 Tax=Algoriphagus machipongonensis TaxID=388413 RepID=A3I2R2_9BACT|nr:TIM barrel protein [Algoriphagus machipongonensis]EAZ79366.1 AP endonuclease, family 2 [Algoriphagus machipongonensis]